MIYTLWPNMRPQFRAVVDNSDKASGKLRVECAIKWRETTRESVRERMKIDRYRQIDRQRQREIERECFSKLSPT